MLLFMRKIAPLALLLFTHTTITAHDGALSTPTKYLSRGDTTNRGIQELKKGAGATVCPAGSTFVDRCIDSAMSIFNSDDRMLFVPPDPNGAAGLHSLIAVVNLAIEGIRKNGTTIFGPTLFVDMFTSFNPSFLFDPKIVYDVHQDRFVVVVLEFNLNDAFDTIIDSNILVAVSKDADPTTTSSSDWYFLKIPSLIDSTSADYPGLAVDDEAVYITANMFPVGLGEDNADYGTGLLWIINKERFYSGDTTTKAWNVYDYIYLADAEGAGIPATHMPARVRNPAGIAPNAGTYLVAYDGLSDSAGKEYVQIIQVKNPLTSPSFQQEFVMIGDIEDTGIIVRPGDLKTSELSLPGAPQRGTNQLISTLDRRALDAVWVNDNLWMVMTVTIVRGGVTETSAYWLKFNADGDTFPPTLADQGYIDGEDIGRGTFTYFPSLDANSKGVVAFGFSASSKRIYGSAYATIRDDMIDPPGTVRKPDLVKAGLAKYYVTIGGGENRWGDYSGMALDPADDDCFWAFNEYAGAKSFTTQGGFGSWKTAWARLCYSPKPKSKKGQGMEKKGQGMMKNSKRSMRRSI